MTFYDPEIAVTTVWLTPIPQHHGSNFSYHSRLTVSKCLKNELATNYTVSSTVHQLLCQFKISHQYQWPMMSLLAESIND